MPGIIMAFREGLEALLITTIILEFLHKSGHEHLRKYVYGGFFLSLLLSLGLGALLNSLEQSNSISKIWESLVSLAAVVLIISFIIWMIKNGAKIKNTIEEKTALKLSAWGIFVLTTTIIAREGVEIVMFSFAGDYPPTSILIGLALAAILAWLIYRSLIKINFKIVFNITLLYLIMQAGYLLGYGLHEGLEAMIGLSYLSEDSWLMTKAFNLSDTILNHKQGFLGLPLHILFGWYSKPQWLQFLAQYIITIYLLAVFWKYNKNN